MRVKLPNDFKLYRGAYWDAMSNLVRKGLTPLSIKDVMFYTVSGNKKEREFLLENTIATSDACIRCHSYPSSSLYGNFPDSDLLIVIPNYERLININPDPRKASYMGLTLSKQEFDKLSKNYEVFSKGRFSDENKKLNLWKDLTIKEVVDNPIWLALAQGDKSLLKEFAKIRFSETKKRYNKDKFTIMNKDKMMSIVFFPEGTKIPYWFDHPAYLITVWYINELGIGSSAVSNWFYPNSILSALDHATLVGTKKQDLESVV